MGTLEEGVQSVEGDDCVVLLVGAGEDVVEFDNVEVRDGSSKLDVVVECRDRIWVADR